jgi:hypothetical protein
MNPVLYRTVMLAFAILIFLSPSGAAASEEARFIVELEGGAVWQSRNDVQIPNDETGTRFSLIDVTGEGPWPAGRLYMTWNINRKHGLRALLAPLSISETGSLSEPVNFAGQTYVPGEPVDATYQFNSWRLTYHYRFLDREKLRLWVGFTAKIRDAKIELSQGGTTSKDTDVGFVPLLHLAADWEFATRWHVLFDFDGLAGGPGRAFDIALKLGHDFSRHWSVTGGYRMVEGGADVDAVYNFAWFHFAVVSGVYRF